MPKRSLGRVRTAATGRALGTCPSVLVRYSGKTRLNITLANTPSPPYTAHFYPLHRDSGDAFARPAGDVEKEIWHESQ